MIAWYGHPGWHGWGPGGWIWIAAMVLFWAGLLAATVYFLTLTPTVPFWDSGEFIAVANILGVPHPPGTPFFVMLARLATLVPWASIAQRVNALSAIGIVSPVTLPLHPAK